MTLQELNDLLKIASENRIDCESYSKDDSPKYSGRGMFGAKTHAITIFGDNELEELQYLAYRLQIKTKVDNLGLGYIVY